MGETPRRSGFRLPWGDTGETKPDSETKPDEAAAAAATPDATQASGDAAAAPSQAPAVAEAPETPAAGPRAAEPEPTQFLRELVDAMRGVAEASRETSLADLRTALDQRIEELRAASADRAEDLRRRSEHDVTTIGEWERNEIDRVRSEAEQRREARGAKLEQELADSQAASDREVAEARQKLTDYERELASFFAELASIADPGTFVATAKRMPPPPELGGSPATTGTDGAGPAAGAGTGSDSGSNGQQSEKTLSERLAQLDQQLAAAAEFEAPAATAATADEAERPAAEEAKPDEPAAEAERPAAEEAKPDEPAAEMPKEEKPDAETPAAAAAEADALTPIVVKGLGSFGAITSFKQALERVDGVRGVTLSLGPTGEFVYRASHAQEFDIVAAIRQIEGPSAGIEQAEGQILVTVERQR